MIVNTRKLTESLENKYKLKEAYEVELEDEIDYIMDDGSLSDKEKEQAISSTIGKYNKKSLGEDAAPDTELPFAETMAGHGQSADFSGDMSWWQDSEDTDEPLNESIAGDIIWEKVRDIIREKIETEIIDNLAMVISSEVPEYNPDWCAESSNQSQWAADKLAEELATELMFKLE